MAIRPKVLMSVGIAFAGLGLIGAGAGASFTAQVSGSTAVTTGGVGLSLNGKSGSGLDFGVDGPTLGSHFEPISHDLLLKDTGTLDLASNYLSVTATGCQGGDDAPLARALRMKLLDVTNDKQLYDGALCSWAAGAENHKAALRQGSTGAGVELPSAPRAGKSILYRLVLQPRDDRAGLPEAAQNSRTSVEIAFTGSDY